MRTRQDGRGMVRAWLSRKVGSTGRQDSEGAWWVVVRGEGGCG